MILNSYRYLFGLLFISFLFSCEDKNDVVKEYWPNGKAKIIYTYSNNDSTTYLKKEFYENGLKKSETNYVNNIKDGKDIGWYKNERKGKEEIYENGKLKKMLYWYESGNKKGEGELFSIDTLNDTVMGVPVIVFSEFGNFTYWKENGKKDYEMEVVDSNTGIIKRYDDSNKITIEKVNRKSINPH